MNLMATRKRKRRRKPARPSKRQLRRIAKARAKALAEAKAKAKAKAKVNVAPKPTPQPAPAPTTQPAPAPTTQPAPNPRPPSTTIPASVAPTFRERLFLNRFGTGFTQKSWTNLRAAGGPESWLETQLSPARVAESSKIAEINKWFAPLFASPADKYAANKAETKLAWTYGVDLGNWSMLRRIYSERSVLETMTDFWTSHFHIPNGHDRAWTYRFHYDEAIRRHALGKFEDLLIECSLHPAMRFYLDNWKSVRNAPNENQGRELLELHTVGLSADYTEAMVKDSAKILSGYTVDWNSSMTPRYDTARHTLGAVRVLDFTHSNSAADGQTMARSYLRHLAHHPSTARRVASKIATYFVSDHPSEGLVSDLAEVYLSSGTDTAAVLRALSTHPEFLTSEGQKLRTPYQDLVATARVLDVQALAPESDASWANAIKDAHGAIQLFSWPRPDGPPITSAGWSSSGRMFTSFTMHRGLAGGTWPKSGATYRAASSWLPAPSIRFDAYVDHLCRTWLGRSADERLLATAVQAVSRPGGSKVISASTVVTAAHPLAGNELFHRLVMALLDSPDHMTT